ncbi:hypothetical protein MMC26_007029 [Xylographa opegraphella]|nr:hypothetical protein [Xylographa opegraphella]
MLKKPSVLFSSYGSLQNLSYPYPTCSHLSTQPQCRHPTRKSSQHRCWTASQRRSFADVKSDKGDSSEAQDLEWPKSDSATHIPTPYQIFRQQRRAPYSKRRFYELAKIYHPDKHAHSDDVSDVNCVSQAVKLERYRLIVAANDILSDPIKRRAYDAYGAGWDGRPEVGSIKEHWRHAQGKGWSGFDDNSSPARCATWEDWEKWYQRNAKGKQEPLYFSNGSFVILIIVFALLGGLGEISRAGKMSRTFLQQIEAVHDESSKDLQRRMRESQGFKNKDERVQNFLKTRDPVGYGVTDIPEEGFRKLLPAPEICMSGDIEARGSSATS